MPSESLLSVFVSAVLPTVSIAAVGYALESRKVIDVDALNIITLYVLTPALIFHSLLTTPIAGETVVQLFIAVATFITVMIVVAEGAGRALGESEPILSALVLTAAFPNAGNFGIPLSGFAFGPIGRSTAVLWLSCQSILMYTVGIYIASRDGASVGPDAVKEVFRLPLVYAVIAAGIVLWAGASPPRDGTVMRTLELTANAAIPVMLLLLGIQLAKTDYGTAMVRAGPATALKLLVAPVVGVLVALAIGFDDQTVARVFVLECATPAAITPLIFSIEYARDLPPSKLSGPEYVSTAIFVTTFGSIPVITVLIAVLRAGVVV